MSRFGGLSEERPSVFKTRSKLGTHLSTQCSGDERKSRPCAAGKEHLLMIDYLSKYVELKPLNSTTEQSVITVMKSIYATHGIPEELVSDGGPPYNSNLMMNFFREWGIKHHVTPPFS
ncbi:uncharacterized protein K02A2.6 [Trichonephila clavipes]|nr:uncharacterized protein K02A2.6 [Trichonephila clavipes]